MKLSDIVEIVENNESCVVMKVKKDSFMELVSLGCFDGNETMIRLTKGERHTYTIWRGEKSISWETGEFICDSLRRAARLITECVMDDFEIAIEGRNIVNTLGIRTKKDVPDKATFKMMWFGNAIKRCVHKDGKFYRHFDSEEKFREWLGEHSWKIQSENDGVSENTGCSIRTLVCAH